MFVFKEMVIFLFQAYLVLENAATAPCTDEFIRQSKANPCDCGNPSFVPVKGQRKNSAMNHRYPWMVGLRQDGKIVCRGTLIASQYILTAAHCLEWLIIYDKAPASVKRIMLEPHLTVALNDPLKANKTIVRSIVDYFVHPTYLRNKGKPFNDIAIIRLQEPVSYTKWLRPTCLSVDPKMSGSGTMIKVLHFGQKKEEIWKRTLVREIDLPIRELNECRKSLESTVLETAICAGGYKDQDSCEGDSGGPAYYTDNEDKGRVYQVGIVSWGNGCGKANMPAVYTRINSFIDWIRDITADFPT